MKLLSVLFTAAVFLSAFTSLGVNHTAAAKRSAAYPADEKSFFNVREFGAKGDGKTVDSDAVNRAIDAASAKGGGTVHFPAGTYLCFSIRLKSNITIFLDNGSTILAADPAKDKGKYDQWEPNEFDIYQDFGHSHWKNSLICSNRALAPSSACGSSVIAAPGI